MGSNKGGENGDYKEIQRIGKPYFMTFFLSLLISIAGSSVLGLWLYKFHSTNRELWMVPFGLILCLTPVIIWFSLIISEACISKSKEDEEEQDLGINQRVLSVDGSLSRDPKRLSKK